MIHKQNNQRDAHAPHRGYALISQMAEEWDVSLRILDQTLHFRSCSLVACFHQKIEMMHQGFLKPGALKRIVCCYFVSVFFQGHYRLLSGYPGYALQVPLGFENAKVGKL